MLANNKIDKHTPCDNWNNIYRTADKHLIIREIGNVVRHVIVIGHEKSKGKYRYDQNSYSNNKANTKITALKMRL